MGVVSTEQYADCDFLLLKHDSGVYECPDCPARFVQSLERIPSGGRDD